MPSGTGGRPSPLACGVVAAVLTVLYPTAQPVAAQLTQDAFEEVTRTLAWREIGPTIMSGRVSDLAVVEADPRIFYVGTATAGVWRTRNAGVTFEALFTDQATASIGDVTVAPSNPNVVWVGTGEPQNRQSSPYGNGVYRSLDGGDSWTHLGLEATHHIARIQVHPSDPDVAYVAAVGHLWGPNPERGVFKTTDGGRTWQHVLRVDDDTGASDLVMHPTDPNTLFAAMYQRRRRAWGFNGGGPGSGIYRTLDGGANWSELTAGLPQGDKGRIGIDIHRANPNFVCAIVEADARGPGQGFGGGGGRDAQNGVYCSTDRGESWEHRSTTNNRPMYYSQIRIDPNDAERIYLGGSSLYRSSDGGRNFTADAASGVHLDHHALWIDPADSDHLLLGSDGGVSVSWDRSDSWYQFRNLPISQFYEIGVDMRDPYHVCGGLQDNGSWCAPSDTRSNQGIRTRDWYNVGSGDGFFTVMHPTDPTTMFAESQGGNLIRVNLTTMERTRIRPLSRPEADAPDTATGSQLRWNWDTPMLLSAHDPNVVYAGANVLFRSPDLGHSWQAVSGDLTHAIDRDTLSLMGVAGSEPQMSRNDGRSNYGNLTAVAESPLDAAVLWAGADDGRLSVTRDGGESWTDVTQNVPELPPFTYVTRLVASHAGAGAAYAAFDGHRSDDFAAYLYATDDFGENWRPITDGLPESPLNALAQHPRRADLLFAGNEVGVYVSLNGGGSWMRLANGLPTVPVDDIKIHPRENDLVIGTHGRGIWIMDDIGPLEELTTEVHASPVHLFRTRTATSYNLYRPQGWTPGIFAADNPEYGARIRYLLGEGWDDSAGSDEEGSDDAGSDGEDAEGSEVTVTILDARGTTVRELDGSTVPGLNELGWDLRLQAPGADGELVSPGPRVQPGIYIVRLDAGDHVVEGEVTVRGDPRVSLSAEVASARRAAMMDSYRLSGPAVAAQRALSEVDDRLDEIARLAENGAGGSEEGNGQADGGAATLAAEVDSVRAGMADVRRHLQRASGGANVWGGIQGNSSAPTADALWQIDRSWAALPGALDAVNRFLAGPVASLYGRAYTDETRPDVPESVEMPSR